MQTKSSMPSRTKFKPANRHERSKKLLDDWYVDRFEHGDVNYRAVKGAPVLVQGKSADAPWQTQYTRKVVLQCKNCGGPYGTCGEQPCGRWEPVYPQETAAGVETRPPPNKPGLRQPLDINAAGNFQPNADLMFMLMTMVHISQVSSDYHRALEMHAAGYAVAAIGEELRCGEWRAGQYVEAGLGIIDSLLRLKPW